MIRLAALACGILCGVGMVLSGLFRPWPVLAAEGGEAALAALAAALGASVLALAAAARLSRPLLGGAFEPPCAGDGWKLMAGGALFGLGWGLAGYVPLGALVSLGLMAPGAAIFLTSVLGGMALHDLISRRDRPRRGLG